MFTVSDLPPVAPFVGKGRNPNLYQKVLVITLTACVKACLTFLSRSCSCTISGFLLRFDERLSPCILFIIAFHRDEIVAQWVGATRRVSCRTSQVRTPTTTRYFFSVPIASYVFKSSAKVKIILRRAKIKEKWQATFIVSHLFWI